MFLQGLKQKLYNSYYWGKYAEAKAAFDAAIPYRNYLPDDSFNDFVKKYSHIKAEPFQDYSETGVDKASNEKINFISQKIKGANINEAVLEIGPGTGEVLKKFKEQGFKRAVAVDILDYISPEAKKAGVECIVTSADNMAVIPDASFDLIVSWSAMEHIPNPGTVFKECLRVLKPGGYLFWRFGPLYYTAWGYHHHSHIRAPYLHILFPEKLIHDYAKQKGQFEGYIPWTNGCILEEYDCLKKPLSYDFILESYTSGYDYYSTDLIIKYPEVFKSKNVSFHNFFVDWIEISLWRKY